MSAFLTWFSGNWKDCIKWVVIGWVAWYATGLITDLRKAELASQKWESNYTITRNNLTTSEASVANLIKEKDTLETKLVEREASIKKLNTDLAAQKNQVAKLRRENERVRAVLTTTIPDELWEQIFPPRHADGNKDGKNQSVGGAAPGVR